MAGYVPNAWAATLLEATVGKTAIATSTVYFGLATMVPENPLDATLANITEVAVTGYARKAVPAFDPAVVTTPPKITTPTEFAFNAFTEDQTVEARWGFLTTAASGTTGSLRYVFELEIPVLGRAGVPLVVPASTLIIE
jgi:hypothetical protein